jgi:DNA-binding MarR family transcriptional regulator
VKHQLRDDLGFLTARAHRALRHWLLSRLDPYGITYPQFVVLTHLREESGLSQTELADRAFMDETSLARMLQRMEEAELIRREVDELDLRVNRVTLTAAGRDLQVKLMPLRHEGLEQATAGLTAEEVSELKRMLDHIFRNMAPDQE